MARNYSWQVQSGDWSVASNWGGTLPTSIDNAYIVNGGTASITQVGETCDLLSLGSTQGTGTIQMNGGSLLADSANVGDSGGAGSFSQSGGTVSIPGLFGLSVGYVNSFGGTYSLSGSGVLFASVETLALNANPIAALFQQSAGMNTTSFLSIGQYQGGATARYQLSGGTLQILNGGLTGVAGSTFDGVNGHAMLSGVNSIVDLSSMSLTNLSGLSVNMGPNSLFIVPGGFDTATGFASYTSLGLTHTTGTTLVVAAGQGFFRAGSINDPVNCQGTITAADISYPASGINLYDGLIASGTANINLGGGQLVIGDSTSGISGGLVVLESPIR